MKDILEELGKFAEHYSKVCAAVNKEDEKKEWLAFIQHIRQEAIKEVLDLMPKKKEIEKEFEKKYPHQASIMFEKHNIKQFIFKSITKVLDAVEPELYGFRADKMKSSLDTFAGWDNGYLECIDQFKQKRKEMGL
jgi:hypothetical protein